jgi:hypothetical protein
MAMGISMAKINLTIHYKTQISKTNIYNAALET